jgi:phage gpG-like protein
LAELVIRTAGFERVIAVTDRLANPNWTELLQLIGLTIEEQTVNHFQEQGGPEGPWPPTQRGGQILVLTGRLRGSITHQVMPPDKVEIGTNVFYGKFHQFGTRNLVRRAFLGLTEADKSELSSVIESYFERLAG